MAQTKPRFYEVEVTRALKAATKQGCAVEIEDGVIRIVPMGVDSGENPNFSGDKKHIGHL